MKHSKAFTIIEMLAIIVIMGIMLVLVLPNLIGVSDKNKQNKYNQLVDNIKLAAETYINDTYDNPTYPMQIPLQTLIDAGYLDSPLTNPLTGNELDYTANVLAIQNADNSITYAYPDISDIGGPIVIFGTNGSLTPAVSFSTIVTVTDDTGLNTSSLKYLWTNSTTVPTEANFSTTFTNGSTITSPNGVSGAYYLWILAKDTSGNTTIKRSNPFKIGSLVPIVVFGTNGNNTYAKTRNTTVTVSGLDLATGSFKYLWTTSTTAPTEASFSTTFTNGSAISSPAGVTGSYYLWILAKNNSGTTTITNSNLFKLDNTIPIITMNGSTPVSIAAGGTYTDAGATATDNIDGTITSSIVATSTVVPTVVGTYTVTYNVNDSSGNAATPVVRTVMVGNPPTYGTSIPSSISTLYGSWKGSTALTSAYTTDDAYSNGNYPYQETLLFSGNGVVVNGATVGYTKISTVNNSSTGWGYVYYGTNTYTLATPSTPGRWDVLYISGGGYTTSASIGGIYLNFSNGASYTMTNAVANGYIQPLVIYSSAAWSSSYIWSNTANTVTGGNTSSGNYCDYALFFKTKTYGVTSITMYATPSFNTTYDGYVVWEYTSNYDLSLTGL